MADFFDVCAEWRQLASYELDDEISELDAARLQRHLDECPACAHWLESVRAATNDLRCGQLAAPRHVLHVSSLRRRAIGMTGVAATVAAAAVVALIGLTQWQLASRERGAAARSAAAVSASPRNAWEASHRILSAAAYDQIVLGPHHVAQVTTISPVTALS
jgi:predicted anti-sigma-YlaC factor YlaD